MRNGKCHKCGSTTIFSQTNGVGGRNGVAVSIGLSLESTEVTSFVCATCGYFENYFTDQKQLSGVKQKWQKVPVEQPRQ